jgi:hypothetical protein
MDLRKRLARLDRLTRPPSAADAASAPAIGRRRDPATVLGALGFTADATPTGPVWRLEVTREHVPRPAGPVPDLAGILPAGTPAGLDWSDVLLVDTETTGLAGGTGTLAFLVGLAWWDGTDFRVRQLFLPAPGTEAPLLADLEELARGFRVVATYNGAGFDLPLLRTRARLARRADPLVGLVGWDLLVAARRCWGRGLVDCRQQTVERLVCRRERGTGDIAGALIPAVYQRYLAGEQAPELAAVLRHNRRDMDGLGLVLAALAAEARAARRAPGDAPGRGDTVGCWSRALIAERRGDHALAAAWARRLLAPDDPEALAPAAVRDAIRLLKRVADWAAVAELVGAGLARWPRDARLHYEAAVLFEHRLRDPGRALMHASILGDARRIARLRARLAAGGCGCGRGAL